MRVNNRSPYTDFGDLIEATYIVFRVAVCCVGTGLCVSFKVTFVFP